MLNSKNIMKVRTWIIGFTLLSIGYAYPQQLQQVPIPIPDGTRMILFVNQDTKISAVDVNGRPAPACQLCTIALQELYGSRCEKAPPASRICKAGTIAAIQVTNEVVIFKSSVNQTCITESAAGQATEICWDD